MEHDLTSTPDSVQAIEQCTESRSPEVVATPLPKWVSELAEVERKRLLQPEDGPEPAYWAMRLADLAPMEFVAGLLNPDLPGMYVASLDLARAIFPRLQNDGVKYPTPEHADYAKACHEAREQAARLGVPWNAGLLPLPPMPLLDETLARLLYVHAYWASLRRSLVVTHRVEKEDKETGERKWQLTGAGDLAEFDGYHFIREYGGQGVAMKWKGDELLIQTMEKLKTSYPDLRVRVLTPKGGYETKNAVDALKSMHETWEYDTAEWLPGKKAPPRVFNLWRGWRWQDVTGAEAERYERGQWPAECDRFMEHLIENVCQSNDEHVQFLLRHVAHALQRPWENSEIALAMIGPMGSGKDFTAEAIGHLFDPHTLLIDQPDQLTSKFNGHLPRSLWVNVSESFFSSRKQADILKARITAERILTEHKGLDSFMAPKSFRICMTSNHVGSLHIEESDRRYFVLEVDGGSERNKNRDYHGALRESWYKLGGAKAFFHWMRSERWRTELAEAGTSIMSRPDTKLLKEQRLLSLDKPEMAIHNMLMSGQPPCEVQWLDGGTDDRAVFLPGKSFLEATRLDDRDQTRLGRLFGAIRTDQDRMTIGHDRLAGHILPELDACRRRWEAHLKQSVDWSSGAPCWAGRNTVEQRMPNYF